MYLKPLKSESESTSFNGEVLKTNFFNQYNHPVLYIEYSVKLVSRKLQPTCNLLALRFSGRKYFRIAIFQALHARFYATTTGAPATPRHCHNSDPLCIIKRQSGEVLRFSRARHYSNCSANAVNRSLSLAESQHEKDCPSRPFQGR